MSNLVLAKPATAVSEKCKTNRFVVALEFLDVEPYTQKELTTPIPSVRSTHIQHEIVEESGLKAREGDKSVFRGLKLRPDQLVEFVSSGDNSINFTPSSWLASKYAIDSSHAVNAFKKPHLAVIVELYKSRIKDFRLGNNGWYGHGSYNASAIREVWILNAKTRRFEPLSKMKSF